MLRRLLPSLLLVLLAIVAGCGGEDGAVAGADGDELVVVTSVAPVTSIAASIIGDRARIQGAVPEGRDSHTYEPPPSLARELAAADVVILNGLGLERPIMDLALATDAADGRVLVELGDQVIDASEHRFDASFPRSGGLPNPHLWTDPTLVKAYASVIRDTMADVDPAGAQVYAENHRRFTAQVDRFDHALRQALDTVPTQDRKLLTYHDSFPYFAERYGWEVLGAVQPADFGQPSPREVAALIDQVRRTGVPAIFGSAEFPSPVIDQIGRETGVRYVDTLSDDVLPGRPGEPQHSWLGMVRDNYATIVSALGGDPAALEAFDVTPTTPDTASYAR